MSRFCARTMSPMVMTGKPRFHGWPVAGLSSAGPVEPMQPPMHIGADEEITLGVEQLARPGENVPPAGLAGDRMRLGNILIAGQRMADQDRVRAIGIELAVGLVCDRIGREALAGIERKRLRDGQAIAGPIVFGG